MSIVQTPVADDDDNAVTVFPDIIVHKRGSNTDNLLVIEFKKLSSRIKKDKDIDKLNAFKRELGYQYALFIELGTRQSDESVTEVIWI